MGRRRYPGEEPQADPGPGRAAVSGVLIACIYLPNGNTQPGPKFDYKLAWFDRLIAHAAELHAAGVPAVLAGDYNVVPTDLDIYPTKSWANDALLQPTFEVRASEVANPPPGDQLTVGGETFVIQEEPERRDPDRLVWSLDVRPS
jgi:hypothetical protein